jgi:hypothetical protein
VSVRPLGILHEVTPGVRPGEITVEELAGCGSNLNIQVGVSAAKKKEN